MKRSGLLICVDNYCFPSFSINVDLFSKVKMLDYEVTVFTANRATATTFNNVFIKLVGISGESERKWLFNLRGAAAFVRGAVSMND